MPEMFTACPKDASHQSTDSDYCSICGAKITGAPEVIAAFHANKPAGTAAALPAAESSVCPDCGTQRRAGARFCEICRYNFDAQTSADPAAIALAPKAVSSPSVESVPQNSSQSAAAPASPSPAIQDAANQKQSVEALPPPIASLSTSVLPPPTPAPSSEQPAPILPAGGEGSVQWEVIIRVDPSLYVEPDPEVACPADEPERVFPIDLSDNLIGRRSPRKDIFPQIPLNDPGISHRHAKILRQPDGSLILLDVGSTNGTQLNGRDVQAGVRTPLRDGDQITLGCWTRITLQSQQAKR